MRRTLKKSLAMFLSAALLFSNSMVTAADSGAAAETHAEDAGGGVSGELTGEPEVTGSKTDGEEGRTDGNTDQEISKNDQTEQETETTETDESEEGLTKTGSDFGDEKNKPGDNIPGEEIKGSETSNEEGEGSKEETGEKKEDESIVEITGSSEGAIKEEIKTDETGTGEISDEESEGAVKEEKAKEETAAETSIEAAGKTVLAESGFSADADGIELSIEAVDDGALDKVSYIEAGMIADDAAIVEAIENKLDDGQEIADYRALDINLYDADGNVIEPDGTVSVKVSGIDPDITYDEIAIFHIESVERNAQAAMPGIMPLSIDLFGGDNSAGGRSYLANKVNDRIDDDIAEAGEISFEVGHFSTYVITFIKTEEEFIEIPVTAVIYDADNNDVPQTIDISGNPTLRIEDESININSLVSGNGLSRLDSDGSTYMYKFATWGSDVKEVISDENNDLTYEGFKEHKEDGIYLWYEDITRQMVPVTAVLGNEPDKIIGISIPAGEITYDKAQEAIEEKTHGVWAYYRAYIKNKQETDDKTEITKVSVINGNYYVVLNGTVGEVLYDEKNYEVVLEFVSARAVEINVTGTENVPGNTVEGEIGDRNYTRQAAAETDIYIPIEIASGYRLTITDGESNIIYDSADNYYRDRSYNLTDDEIGIASEINIEFEKLTTKTLDISNYIIEEKGNLDTGGSQYHGATLTVNGNKIDLSNYKVEQGTDNIIGNPIIELQDKRNVIVVSSTNESGVSWVLNSLGFNGEAVEIDGEPHEIYDMNDDPMAKFEVSGDIATGYTITITSIKTNLVITDFNYANRKGNEARFVHIGDGISISAMIGGEKRDDEYIAANGLWSKAEDDVETTDLTFTPDIGYYISGFLCNSADCSNEFAVSKWFDPKIIRTFNIKGAQNQLEINSELITFRFRYKTSDVWENGKRTFTLDVNAANTGSFDQDILPESIPEGKVFMGWSLSEDGGISGGYYAKDSAYGVPKSSITKDNIDYSSEKGEAFVKLYPVYVDSFKAQNVGYSVIIHIENKQEIVLKAEDGLSSRPIGSYIQRDTLLQTVSPIHKAVEKLKDKGYELDTVKSNVTITMDEDAAKNVFELYFKPVEIRLTFSSAYGFEDDTRTSIETMYKAGSELSFAHEPKAEAVDADGSRMIFAGWDTPDKKLPETVPGTDTVYTALYEPYKAADEGNEDNNGDETDTPQTPDDGGTTPDGDGQGGDAGDNGNTGSQGSSSGGRNESNRDTVGSTYYTVGVNGNWRHMDNEDVNAVLDEAVPAGATAMGAPEWHRWKFFLNDGSNIRGQWAHIANPYAVDDQPKTGWFYFDSDGLMQYGWLLDMNTGKWYYLHSDSDGMLGTMMTGWHYDSSDRRWYYLDPESGEMALGWKDIGGKWYYFNETPSEQTWELDSTAGLWRFNNSKSRPLGSMYAGERTPDGYSVDANGVWVQ